MQRHAAWRTRALCRQAVASSGGPSEIECRWIADLLGDYLDGRLPRHTRELIDFHIDRCPPCVAFINTYRGAIDAARKLGVAETGTGTPVTDEIASRRIRHRVGGGESCGATDAALSRDPALPVEQGSTRGLHLSRLYSVIGFIQNNMTQKLTILDLSFRRGNDRLFRTTRLLRVPEPLQLRIELHPGDPKRGRRGRLVALGLREGIRDRVSFEFLKGRLRNILIRDA